MGLYTSAVSSVLFPIHEKLKGHDTVGVRKQLELSQWLSPEELVELQLTRLRQFLTGIGLHVPYYRQLFDETGFKPESIHKLEQLAQLPILDKPLIRANTNQLKSPDATDLARFNTGGSSGEPLVFYIGKDRVSHDVAAKWRATRWWGVDIGDPELVVWGSPIELQAQDRVRLLRDKLLRTELLPAFEMSEQKLDEFLAVIRNKRPAMLFGYPSALALIAKHAELRRQNMNNLGIRVAFVTSERLYPEQREAIERVFGCPVANGYGGRDAGFIAHECPDGGMHITCEDIIVEIVDENFEVLPQGEAGEIVVTHMYTSGFPFLRYRTGDVGVLSSDSCRCGRGLPLIDRLDGRTTDFIFAADGTILHGLALIYVLRDLESVEQFKIVQMSMDETDVFVVANGSWSQNAAEQVIDAFKTRLGNDVAINIRLVESIEAEASGKMRYVISHVRRREE